MVVICTSPDMWFPHSHWEEMWHKVPTVQVSMDVLADKAMHMGTFCIEKTTTG